MSSDVGSSAPYAYNSKDDDVLKGLALKATLETNEEIVAIQGGCCEVVGGGGY